jgi:hypothetical protein
MVCIQGILTTLITSSMAFHMQGSKNRKAYPKDRGRSAGQTASTHRRQDSYMRRVLMRLYSRFTLAVILAAGIGANAQDVASDTSKAAKDSGHATAKAAQATEHGTEKAVEKTSSATGHAVKKTAHGVKKGVTSTGHELKGDESKPETPK